jgi:DNA-binding MarR family transcriptional regulator
MTEEPTEMSILFDLWLINHLLSGALDEVLVDASGLTGEDFGFYSLLRRFGPLTPTQVSRWTAMPATTVSATVRRLASRGHVEQVRHPADGRSRLIALTDIGVATHAASAGVFFTQTRSLATALGSDEHRQRLSLQRLDAALRQVSGLDPRPYAVSATTAAGTEQATEQAATDPAVPAVDSTETARPHATRPPTAATRNAHTGSMNTETGFPAADVGAGGSTDTAGNRWSQLTYPGPNLRPGEEDSVRTYIDFVRSQRK